MRFYVLLLLLAIISNLSAQPVQYEPNKYPYGQLNPSAPGAVGDFEMLIGESSCLSISRNPDQTWQDTLTMSWTFKYILNGTAVQDITIKEGGQHATSIRQYQPDSALWYVTYFSSNNVQASPSTWAGKKEKDNDIVLYLEQKAPNGMEGYSRLTFTEISNQGFHWKGEWISSNETIVYPFWKIYCEKNE